MAESRSKFMLGECRKVIRHRPEGGRYAAVAVNSEGILAVTDKGNKCVHFITKEGVLVKSATEGVFGGLLASIAYDQKGNVWVSEWGYNNVFQVSQDGQLLQTIHHAGSESDCFSHPCGVSVSTEGLVYICDRGNHRVTVHDEDGKFLFAFGSKGSGPGCLNEPVDIEFGSDGLVYVTDVGHSRVCVWSKEGTFKRDFTPKHTPTCIAATSDNHLLITSFYSHSVMVYTLDGELVHEFGGNGSDPGRLNGPLGICVDENELIYVVDHWNLHIQVF